MTGTLSVCYRMVICLIGIAACYSYAQAASFSCVSAVTRVEKMICADLELSRLDDLLASEYQTAVISSEQAESLRTGQRAWLRRRDACRNPTCVGDAYESRIFELRTAGCSIDFTTSKCAEAVRKLSLRQANLAYECSEALFYLFLDPTEISETIISQLDGLRVQFDNFCPPFGYKPFRAETRQFNEQHREPLARILRERHPNAPAGTRIYDNTGRSPAIFSDY